jgi:DnaJ-domain-containing protein 1
MINPLIPELLELLHQQPNGISEYEILKNLGAHTGFSHFGDDGQLALFQKHFLIMNGLYQLQQSLWDEKQLLLHISPLRVAITSAIAGGDASHPAISESAPLRHYYLDWSNLEATTEEDVLNLQQAFWQRFHNANGRDEALATLGLDTAASTKTINACYRQLAAEHHPDKGGCSERFIEIRKAYELLKTAT